jgi:hypothetical protein
MGRVGSRGQINGSSPTPASATAEFALQLARPVALRVRNAVRVVLQGERRTVMRLSSSRLSQQHTATKIPFMYFSFWELRRLSPNFHIHVFVSDFYIPMIGLHISYSRIGRSIGGIYK